MRLIRNKSPLGEDPVPCPPKKSQDAWRSFPSTQKKFGHFNQCCWSLKWLFGWDVLGNCLALNSTQEEAKWLTNSLIPLYLIMKCQPTTSHVFKSECWMRSCFLTCIKNCGRSLSCVVGAAVHSVWLIGPWQCPRREDRWVVYVWCNSHSSVTYDYKPTLSAEMAGHPSTHSFQTKHLRERERLEK